MGGVQKESANTTTLYHSPLHFVYVRCSRKIFWRVLKTIFIKIKTTWNNPMAGTDPEECNGVGTATFQSTPLEKQQPETFFKSPNLVVSPPLSSPPWPLAPLFPSPSLSWPARLCPAVPGMGARRGSTAAPVHSSHAAWGAGFGWVQ